MRKKRRHCSIVQSTVPYVVDHVSQFQLSQSYVRDRLLESGQFDSFTISCAADSGYWLFFRCFFSFEMQNNSSQPKKEKSTARRTRPTLVEKMAMMKEIYAGANRYVFVLAAVSWSIDQSNIQSINQAIDQSINQSINQSIKRSFNQSIDQAIDQSINQSINQSSDHSIDQAIDQSMNQPMNESNCHYLKNAARIYFRNFTNSVDLAKRNVLMLRTLKGVIWELTCGE